MKTTMIENLYFDLISGSEYQAAEQIEYAKLTDQDLNEFLDTIKDKSVRDEFGDRAAAVGAAGEANGFVMGFKYAMNLMNECRQ